MRQSKGKKGLACLWLSIGGFLCMSVSILLMPLEAVGILPGLLFWGGMIVGVIFQIVLEVRRRSFFAGYNIKREKLQKPRNGFLTFGSNRAAVIADIVLAVSVAATVLALVFTNGSGYLCYVCIALLLFCLCLHCIFNGRNYFHVNNQNKVRQVLEQKKANSIDKGEGENGKS